MTQSSPRPARNSFSPVSNKSVKAGHVNFQERYLKRAIFSDRSHGRAIWIHRPDVCSDNSNIPPLLFRQRSHCEEPSAHDQHVQVGMDQSLSEGTENNDNFHGMPQAGHFGCCWPTVPFESANFFVGEFFECRWPIAVSDLKLLDVAGYELRLSLISSATKFLTGI